MKAGGRDESIDRLLPHVLHAAAASESGPECLDAETLAAWADSALSPPEREDAERHAANCERCQAMMAAMAGFLRAHREVRCSVASPLLSPCCASMSCHGTPSRHSLPRLHRKRIRPDNPCRPSWAEALVRLKVGRPARSGRINTTAFSPLKLPSKSRRRVRVSTRSTIPALLQPLIPELTRTPLFLPRFSRPAAIIWACRIKRQTPFGLSTEQYRPS